MIAEKTYSSESNHWYRWDGTPCHEVPYKSRPGEFRNATLKDARTLNLVPSVSGILSIQAKPGLDNWKKSQVAKAALDEALDKGVCNDEEFILNVIERAESQMSKARDLGTEIHGLIEKHLKWVSGQEGPQGAYCSKHVEAAISALKDFGAWGQPFRAERSFASPLGYGGCLDFCTDTHISDFKCVDSLEKKLDYPERCAQLSGYSMGVHGKLVRCANVFISTSEPGRYLLREWTKDELQYGWELFTSCFALWKCVNRFDPVLNASTTGVS